jgi:hypothetical protein
MLNNMSFLYNQTSSSVKINFDTGNLFFIIYAYVFVIVMFNEIQNICCIDMYVADGAQEDLAKQVKSNNHAELFKIVRDK